MRTKLIWHGTPEQRLGMISWIALIMLQLTWHAWLFPATSTPVWLGLLFTVVPLLLPLLALRNPPRSLLWVGMLSLFYFCHGVSEAWSSPSTRALAIIEIIITLLLIGLLGAGVRHKRAG